MAKKFRELQEAINKQEKAIAMNLADKLYNDLRDFSQAIDVFKDGDKIVVRPHGQDSGEYLFKCKETIREWVGGHWKIVN